MRSRANKKAGSRKEASENVGVFDILSTLALVFTIAAMVLILANTAFKTSVFGVDQWFRSPTLHEGMSTDESIDRFISDAVKVQEKTVKEEELSNEYERRKQIRSDLVNDLNYDQYALIRSAMKEIKSSGSLKYTYRMYQSESKTVIKVDCRNDLGTTATDSLNLLFTELLPYAEQAGVNKLTVIPSELSYAGAYMYLGQMLSDFDTDIRLAVGDVQDSGDAWYMILE